MTKHGRSWLAAGAVTVVVFISLGLLYRSLSALPRGGSLRPQTLSASRAATGAAANTPGDMAGDDSKTPAQDRGPRGSRRSARAGTGKVATDAQVVLLDELLDGDDRDATLAQARKMAVSPDAPVRSAALGALRWLGGKEAALALATMLNDADPELADEAADGLISTLSDLDDPALSAAVLEEAIQKVPTGGAAEAMLLSISGLPETLSVPVLLNLLENRVPRVSALAKEYLEFVTGGEAITSRTEGEAWLRKRAQDEAEAEKN